MRSAQRATPPMRAPDAPGRAAAGRHAGRCPTDALLHPAGAQRRAVPRHRAAAGRSAASARAPRCRKRCAWSSRSACCCRASPKSTSRARTTCTGSAPAPPCCATSPRPKVCTTRSCKGLRRFRVLQFLDGYPYRGGPRAVRRRPARPPTRDRGPRPRAEAARARGAATAAAGAGANWRWRCRAWTTPAQLADFIAGLIDIPLDEKQALLETFDLKTRLDKVLELLARRLEVLKVSRDVDQRTRESIGDLNRKHLLREQMRTIQKELGEDDEGGAEIAELEQAITEAKMPEDVDKVARKELKRLERMPEAAGEYSMLRTYLEWLIELPWTRDSGPPIDIAEARAHPRRRPFRAGQDQAAHPRIPGGAQAEPGRARADPVFRRAAGCRQDLARPEHRARDRTRVRARQPGRRARRGRDPRPPAHLHRRAAGQRHPDAAQASARATA